MGAVAYSEERWKITSERYEEMIRAGTLTGDDRVELLEGEIVPMSPIGDWHDRRTDELDELIERVFDRNVFRVREGRPLVLPNDSQPEPDLSVVERAASDGLRARTAVLVIEVADTTLRRDRRKAPLYASARIPEYWIVNRADDTVEVFREPIAVASSSTGFEYRSMQVMRRGESVRALDANAPVTVDELLGEPSELS